MADADIFEKKVTISFRLKYVVIALLVIGAFLAGRYLFPANGISIGEELSEGLGKLNATLSNKVSNLTKATGTAANTSGSNLVSNQTAALQKSEPENTTTTTENTTTESQATEEKTITGNYKNVKLEFSREPSFDWKGTWGKIETIYYRITNNEQGTIAPATFLVLVEGYELDNPEEVAVITVDRTIKEGEVREHGFDIDFSYSQVVTDPENIKITMELHDARNQTIATVQKEFNLKE